MTRISPPKQHHVEIQNLYYTAHEIKKVIMMYMHSSFQGVEKQQQKTPAAPTNLVAHEIVKVACAQAF